MESENCACGGAVDGTSGCCEKCKKSTSEDKTRPVMAGLCCPECDTVALQKTAKFCSECGHKFKIEKLDASLKSKMFYMISVIYLATYISKYKYMEPKLTRNFVGRFLSRRAFHLMPLGPKLPGAVEIYFR